MSKEVIARGVKVCLSWRNFGLCWLSVRRGGYVLLVFYGVKLVFKVRVVWVVKLALIGLYDCLVNIS